MLGNFLVLVQCGPRVDSASLARISQGLAMVRTPRQPRAGAIAAMVSIPHDSYVLVHRGLGKNDTTAMWSCNRGLDKNDTTTQCHAPAIASHGGGDPRSIYFTYILILLFGAHLANMGPYSSFNAPLAETCWDMATPEEGKCVSVARLLGISK